MVIIQNELITAENSKSDPYGVLRVSASRRAARELSGTAYKIFVELALNQDGHKMVLSKEAFKQELGISPSAYKGAINELIEKGYLYPEPSGKYKNAFIFTPKPPRAKARTEEDIGQKVSDKRTKNVQSDNDKVEQPNEVGQKTSSNGTENNPTKGQKTSSNGTENNPETIQANTYNTDSNNVSGVENVQCENDDDSSLDKEDTEMGIVCDFDEDRAFRVRLKFQNMYYNKVKKANGSLTIRSILDTYLSTPRELEVHRLRRRKYGVWIRGWDSDRGEPIIYYPVSHLFDCEMKHENVKDIPPEYYHEKYNEMHSKCSRNGLSNPDRRWDIQFNRYPKLEDTPEYQRALNASNEPEENNEMIAISEDEEKDEIYNEQQDDEYDEVSYEDLMEAIDDKFRVWRDDDLPF